jgi:hypothetical protein
MHLVSLARSLRPRLLTVTWEWYLLALEEVFHAAHEAAADTERESVVASHRFLFAIRIFFSHFNILLARIRIPCFSSNSPRFKANLSMPVPPSPLPEHNFLYRSTLSSPGKLFFIPLWEGAARLLQEKKKFSGK